MKKQNLILTVIMSAVFVGLILFAIAQTSFAKDSFDTILVPLGIDANFDNTKKDHSRNTKAPVLPPPTPSSPSLLTNVMAGNPSDVSAVLHVIPAENVQLAYRYGTTANNLDQQTPTLAAKAGEPSLITLIGLQPDTQYYYQLLINSAPSLTGSFHTQRAKGSSFNFTMQGDSHPELHGRKFDAKLYTHTLLAAGATQPDFHITIGDDFSPDRLKVIDEANVRSLYFNQRLWLSLVGAPVFLSNGNHEQSSLANYANTPNNISVLAQNNRNLFFVQPAPDDFYSGNDQPVEGIGSLRNYYSFTWGDALFVFIDPYWHTPTLVDKPLGQTENSDSDHGRDLWLITLGDQQYHWFKATLEGSHAKYKFVISHHVLGTGQGGIELSKYYEWGGKNKDGSEGFAEHRPGWEKPIHQLMVDNHVTIFFQGHDHLYAHQQIDGITYQTLPMPANPNHTGENMNIYQSGTLLPSSGFINVSVSPKGVNVSYTYCSNEEPDQLADTYNVK